MAVTLSNCLSDTPVNIGKESYIWARVLKLPIGPNQHEWGEGGGRRGRVAGKGGGAGRGKGFQANEEQLLPAKGNNRHCGVNVSWNISTKQRQMAVKIMLNGKRVGVKEFFTGLLCVACLANCLFCLPCVCLFSDKLYGLVVKMSALTLKGLDFAPRPSPYGHCAIFSPVREHTGVRHSMPTYGNMCFLHFCFTAIGLKEL